MGYSRKTVFRTGPWRPEAVRGAMAGVLLLAAGAALALSPEDIALISRSAERGNDASQVLLAVAYMNGDGGLRRDEARAAHWFELAALQGNAYAEERIGDCYEGGQGVPANAGLAFDWRLKAAQRGNVQAQVKLARMYLAGTGTARSPEQAQEWLERAAVEGSAEAQYLLGRMAHESDDSVARRNEALTWLERAAKQGYEQAIGLLNLIRSIGYEVNEGWHHHAPKLAKLAADGDPEAQYLLAQRYEHGANGMARDPAEAMRWYKAAAETGHRPSMLALSQMLETGAGVPRDPVAARNWAERAAAATSAAIRSNGNHR